MWSRFYPTVSSQGPSVFPLKFCKTTKGGNSVTLGCLVSNYFPEPVTVTWDVGSLKSNISTFPATLLSTSGLYTTTSQVTVFGEWAEQKFTCNVEHAGSAPINKTVSICPSNITLPTVRLFHSSCDPSGNTAAIIQLLCLISNFTPGDIEVTWLVEGQKTEGMSLYNGPHKQEGNLSSTFSQLNVTQGQWVSQRTYTCQVNYQGCTLRAYARNCPESEPRGVSIYVIPPSPLDLYLYKSPYITCLVVDLASVEGINLTWSQKSGNRMLKATNNTRHHFNMTYTFISTLPVDTDNWTQGETYTCKLTHPHLPRSIERSIAKAPGKRVAPEVYMLLPSEEEQKNKSTVTLACLIQNFFPADISVQWLQDEKPLPLDQHSTTWPIRDAGPSPAFFVFSRLEVNRTHWEKKNTFTCQVIHEALPNKILQKSVFKVPEVELQDLCVGAAEGEELDGLWSSLLVFILLFLLSVTYSASVTLVKVKWVVSAALQETPPTTHDYANVLPLAAWARGRSCTGPATSLPTSGHH
nr:immunoglobulin heavy constant epsilon [Molossus molossus]